MNRFERKEIVGHGTAREVARKLECAESTVSDVIHDRAGNTPLTRRIRRELARRAGYPLTVLFPPRVFVEQEGEQTDGAAPEPKIQQAAA